ncbi:MAG: Rieske (2Fe-2S) iron-sulfur domain protein [Frankiales bacterium]|jgi:nitrite reductase/ring-hydroxylating ferredoxin subunit|nr:Rieske (2Fe-2S) iron-sulfur domain protein [Frankiales bacterium]
MTDIPSTDVPRGAVTRVGSWTLANPDGEVRAVSSRCRHQLGDLSKGTLDANGCLVCPWHGSRYDLDTGAMVSGPHGFLWYVGRTPGYTQLVQWFGAVVKLRRAAVVRVGERLRVGA